MKKGTVKQISVLLCLLISGCAAKAEPEASAAPVSIEETNHNGMVYCATIIQMFTAEPENRKEDDSILIVLDREKTEVGKTYLCGFDPVEEHSLLYTQMTLDGLFSAEDEAAVSEARAFFGK